MWNDRMHHAAFRFRSERTRNRLHFARSFFKYLTIESETLDHFNFNFFLLKLKHLFHSIFFLDLGSIYVKVILQISGIFYEWSTGS